MLEIGLEAEVWYEFLVELMLYKPYNASLES